MNAKIIDALKGVRDNLNIIIEETEKLTVSVEISEEPVKEVAKPIEKKVVSKKDNVVPLKKEVEEPEEELLDPSEEITEESLATLSYNDLKKFAKEVGVTATGARAELTKKILNASSEDVQEEEETEEEAPKKKTESKKSPVKLGKKEEPELEEEELEEEEVDPIVAKVNEAVEDMTDEDILDVLTDVGVRAKGKRQALISAVIKAVKEGKIELDDGGEDTPDEEPEIEEEETSGELDINDFDNEEMTDERRKAMQDFEASTRADFEEGAITRKDLVDWLNEYNGTKGAMKNKSDEEIVEEYIYYSWLLIDDEGEMPEEEGAYTVNGHPYCCGRELEYLEENNTFICEYCGTEYEGA